PVALLDAAQIVRHRPARDRPQRSDRLIERELQRLELTRRTRRRTRRARPEVRYLSFRARLGDGHPLAGALVRLGRVPRAQRPVRRLRHPQRVAPLPGRQLGFLPGALLLGTAAVLPAFARIVAEGRRARLRLVLAAFLLDLRERVLEE